jgi:hypothetical protein
MLDGRLVRRYYYRLVYNYRAIPHHDAAHE